MEKRKVIFGIILVAIGFLLLAKSLGLFDFSLREFGRFVWPVVLILVGVWLVIRKRGPDVSVEYFSKRTGTSQTWSSRGGSDKTHKATPGLDPSQAVPPNFVFGEAKKTGEAPDPRSAESPSFTSEGRVKYSKVLGDLFVECDGIDLRNVEISGGAGDIEIRLRGGKLSPGLNRMVISNMLGDTRITVPRTIAWYAQASNFAGDVEIGEKRTDGFGNQLEGQSPDYATAQSKLYIVINSFLGDIKVYPV